MRKDIFIPSPTNLCVAIVLENEATHEWKAYILNLNKIEVNNIMITSSGKSLDGKNTSTLRHFIDIVCPNTAIPFELVTEELLQINNTFFVTYYMQDLIHDFEAEFESKLFEKSSLRILPILNKMGVMINHASMD